MMLSDQYDFTNKIAALPFVEAIYLFGSRARGNHRRRSDIDIAVYCPTASEAQWQEVLNIIDEADTLLPIDCIRLDAEPEFSSLKLAIETEKKVIYERAH